MGDWDIESYRSFYESDEHWALKKEFMETHYDTIPEDRLVCLAQVYANIELLGCRYPAKVMEEINDLARGIGLTYKERKKTKLQRTFVKASDAAGAKVRGDKGEKRKNPYGSASHEPLSKKKIAFVKPQCSSSNEPLVSKPVSFVAAESTGMAGRPQLSSNEPFALKPVKFMAAESTGVPDRPQFSSNDSLASKPVTFVAGESTGASKDRSVEDRTVNPIMSFIKAVRDDAIEEGEILDVPEIGKKESPEADKCLSFIQSIRASSPEQNDKADKYRKAAQKSAKQRITYPDAEPDNNSVGRGIGCGNFRSRRGRGTQVSGHSNDRGRYTTHLQNLRRSKDPLCSFILVQRVYAGNANPNDILVQSGHFSQMPVSCTHEQNGQRCHIAINGVHVCSAKGSNKKASKDAAIVKALEILIQRCFTLRILKLHSSVEEVSVSEIKSGSSTRLTSVPANNVDTPLEDSSVGSKLLKMMGWAGGGLGKDGSGIAEPIKPQHIFGRAGLGHEGGDGVNKFFTSKIEHMLQEYRTGSDGKDLAFSPLFSKEQRAEIHRLARKMRLKSQSHGHGQNRFLVISRRIRPKQLLEQLLLEGPTDKYELIAPGETSVH